MKQIQVTDLAADEIEHLRETDSGYYEAQMETILDILSGMSYMVKYARDNDEVAQFVDNTLRAIDLIFDYSNLLKMLSRGTEIAEDGIIEVKQKKQNES